MKHRLKIKTVSILVGMLVLLGIGISPLMTHAEEATETPLISSQNDEETASN